MPAEDSLNPLIYRAAGLVREARHQLLDPSPANLHRCLEMFAVATSCVESMKSTQCGPGSDRDQAALMALRRDIAAVVLLLEKAAAFHGSLLNSMRAQLSADAPAATAAARVRVQVEA